MTPATKRPAILIGSFLLILLLSYFYFDAKRESYNGIVTFEDCVSAGFRVLPIYPEVCVMPGKTFKNPKQKLAESDPHSETTSSTDDRYKNSVYFVEGQTIKLENGTGTFIVLGNSHQASTTISIPSDQKFIFDLNNDTKLDTIFLLKLGSPFIQKQKQDRYYLTALLSGQSDYLGTNGIYVDSNIGTSSFVYKNGEINLSYMTISSTTTKIKYYTLNNNLLRERQSK
jgi:hypothetical protein